MINFEGTFQFQLEVSKPKDGTEHSITLIFEENRVIFMFPGEGGGSAPLSKRTNNHSWEIERPTKNYPETGRQRTFEALVVLLGTVHPDGVVPVFILDANGTEWRLDKSASEWAAESRNFVRVTDSQERHYLRHC